jgi:8-oxo-dGTP pyrophosphatase MutT (NUDIX family)
MRDACNPVRQAGGIVFRRLARASRVLVVRSSDELHWLFPKGHVEPGESRAQAATREVREEAGVVATVRGFVGRERYMRGPRPVEVSYYVLD